MQIYRLNRVTTIKVDAIEALRQFQQILVIDAVAYPPAVIKIRDIGRTGNLAKSPECLAKNQCAIYISRGYHDAIGRFRHLLHHQSAIHTHGDRAIFYFTACLLENLPGAIVQKINADFLQNPHCRIMNIRHALGI